MIEKQHAIEILNPLLQVAAGWWLHSLDLFDELHDDDLKFQLGPRHRAEFLRDLTLSQSRGDPVIASHFVPSRDDQLEGLVLDGSPTVTVLFNKVRRNREGRLQSMSRSFRQQERRRGQLKFDGAYTIPIVCFYVMETPVARLNPRYERIGIGFEEPDGFAWIHTLWTDEDGLTDQVVHPQMPLFPGPVVKLRKPDQIPASPIRVSAKGDTVQKKGKPDDSASASQGA